MSAMGGPHAPSAPTQADKNEFPEFNTNPVTLSNFFMDQHDPGTKPAISLSIIVQAIGVASKVIANAVQRAGSQGLYALRGTGNESGEDQKKLDVLANDVFVNVLRNTKKVAVMVSEEIEGPVIVGNVDHARYGVVFDPLDGSSNIECNVSVGTIFGIYHAKEGCKLATLDDIMQPGTEMVAAGYVLYSSSVILVLSCGKGVHSFTLDPTFGEFIMTQRNMKLPKVPKRIYSVNTGNAENWDEPTKNFVRWTKQQGKPYSHRYIGSMVSDVHRTLLYGGIFMYPADAKNKNGKLRLLYECFPMAFLMEQAGGLASTGTQRILDIQPTGCHGRAPIFLGSKGDVEKVIGLYKEAAEHPERVDQSELLV